MTHAVASIETSHQLTFQSKQSSLHSKLDSNRSNSYRFSKLTCWFSELGGYWVDVQRLDIFLTTHKSCSFASHVAVWIGDAFKQVR